MRSLTHHPIPRPLYSRSWPHERRNMKSVWPKSKKRLIHGYYQFGCWQNGQGDRLIPAEVHSVWGVYRPN